MTPYEIMLSESQERMVFVVHPEDVEELMDVFEKYELPSAVVGEVIEGDQFVATLKGEILARCSFRITCRSAYSKKRN